MAIVNQPVGNPVDDPRFTQNQAYGGGRMGRTDLPEEWLPKEVVGDIFSKVEEDAPLLSMGRQINVSMGETVIRYGGTDPEAGQVGAGTSFQDREGHRKPLSGFAFGEEKSFAPIKIATTVVVSDEFSRINPERFYSELSGKLSGAIGRATELAAFHNRSALTGGALQGTSNNKSVVGSIPSSHITPLDLAVDADQNLVEQLLAAYDLVVGDEDANYDFTSWAAVPAMRSKLALARDRQGNLAFQGGSPLQLVQGPVNVNATVGDLLGVPVRFGKAVGGRIGNYAGTDVKLIGGDFSQFAYGFADGIRIKVSDQATVDGVSMWQTNQIAILAECTFGWYVNAPEDGSSYPFAAFTVGAPVEEPETP